MTPYVMSNPSQQIDDIRAPQAQRLVRVRLGQVVEGVNVSDLKAGMEMELVLETLFEDEESEKLTWKWKPAAA